jgi:hypothetical protein
MSRWVDISIDPAASPDHPVQAAGDEHLAGPRFSTPASAALTYAAIRLLGLAVAAFLLPRGRFARLHFSLAHLITSWDSGRYLIIAAHGYSYAPGNLRQDVIFAWFPGYPAALDTLAWIPGVGPAHAGFAVTVIAGLAAAWGLARLGLALTGDRRVSLLIVALWAVAPGSIVLSMLYAEALFCALAVWALVALVERRWLTAAGLVILAGTVRSTALALIAAVAVAALPPVVLAVRAREPLAAWWRPAAALPLAPLGLVGYWGYAAFQTHRLDGWFWVEKNAHLSVDWGRGMVQTAEHAVMSGPSPQVALTLLVIAAAVTLAAWSLADRLPAFVYAYTFVVVLTALVTGPFYLGSKPRFLLPAVLLGLPLARLLAPARTWILVPLIAVLAAASTWFGLYLMSVGWAP